MANRFFEGAVHAASYAKFRPQPPASLIDRVLTFLKEKYQGPFTAAIDVGCGSGQSTHILSPHFTSVTGLDISQAQITEATKLGTGTNVFFKVSGAEKLPFSECSLQLVTAGQACHWFDLPKFYEEVDRILVPGGVLALYGYAFPQPIYGDLTEKLYDIINYMYKKELNGYIYRGSEEVYLERYQAERYKLIYDEHLEYRCMKKTRVATGEVVVKMLMLLIAIKSSAYLTQVIQG
ncbi:putative methyltransferase DDB_G0268948 isoform X1 [Homarus americanus]|uniref:putative methyltransferase DDB_G0268948 isoform X1 n=1 Tax=Homarus americanus TaxID=6706 RepID=UPI001C44727B|nr:putative methyltransferase DDB_G0268948 isoform X1 [Homarus americanus]XP_042229771.1 putative methyltransferase DDB_G0268948 isoform X1 [Homarus americanus]XP_042229772.1 putative methyltransferase DDB_G0268948 isoform X1 [Homarus americanus]XP_042229773.1 putative methyltransferase DDB_G0268948 isoform X1 [Homarus americanus]